MNTKKTKSFFFFILNLTFSDLVKNGSCFEINSKFSDIEDMADFFPEDERPSDDENKENEQEVVQSPWNSSFEELKLQLTKFPDYEIYKKIIKEGNGNKVGAENARMSIHYNGYWENELHAFDSTYMRGFPKVFNVGQSEVLPGIELAVKSMSEGEEAQFVITYKLLFGELGCPSRIKPKANGLFIINLLKISLTGDETGVDKLSESDKRKFAIVMPKARAVHTKGKDVFNLRNWPAAARLFHKAILSLETCQLANIEEQKEQQAFIVQMYTNLAVCYNQMGLPAKTCSMCNEISRISDISKNKKALFHEGRALLKLGEFKKAETKLKKALKLAPADTEIGKELRLLAEKFHVHTNEEKQIWQRAFGNMTPLASNPTPSVVDEVGDRFRAMTLENLKIFNQNSTQSSLQLPPGLSLSEMDCVKDLIRDMPIQMKLTDANLKKYSLIKDINEGVVPK